MHTYLDVEIVGTQSERVSKIAETTDYMDLNRKNEDDQVRIVIKREIEFPKDENIPFGRANPSGCNRIANRRVEERDGIQLWVEVVTQERLVTYSC